MSYPVGNQNAGFFMTRLIYVTVKFVGLKIMEIDCRSFHHKVSVASNVECCPFHYCCNLNTFLFLLFMSTVKKLNQAPTTKIHTFLPQNIDCGYLLERQ